MANGATRYQDGVLICDQGNPSAPSALTLMKFAEPHSTSIFVQNFLGTQFNSPNDVVVHTDGSVWLTDPAYGFEQGFRPKPSLPSQVYRYDPKTRDIRPVADGFDHPNGLAFSPDEKTLYITDTGSALGNGSIDRTRPSTIYAFDLKKYSKQMFLTNRRLFAMSDNGVPDGIKVDQRGNVYAGCGDGIHVWSPGGVLLGKILIPGGIANFVFGKGGYIFALGEKKLWLVGLAA
ncbi:calcium-dependent phosphotriesterase [Myriangium duriaei CBS 260.36]|uniref:Calcium-dependent phosphotriesterase n=1 Tax=Myriangium duriaei CBS 260.36 TaxID=1168546 RepID=A0A9P4IQP3_9PEZI|nr:calcium-dependent phosphotriesterase [Myriangium duriaei CBS 260.36]